MGGISRAAAAFTATVLACLPVRADDTTCPEHDRYATIMAGARTEWPESNPVKLSPEWTEYFMLGYNDDQQSEEPTVADTVVAFPLPPDIAATSYFFGFVDDCLTFYADLTEAKVMHLIEKGHAIAESGKDTPAVE
jgi:hypothetical protein|tara:strand:+ start:1282 stop:1689 length:408 start_codon:yes stop_codon:yes gene_type:complete